MTLKLSLAADSGKVLLPRPMLDVEFAQLSDTGRIREHNEDYLGNFVPATPALARSHGWLFVLADGVGGHEKGEVASSTAVECVLKGFGSSTGQEGHSTLLPRLVRDANLRVFENGQASRPGGVAMATTIVACSLRYDRAIVSHVGDSRCYLVRRGRGAVLTRDHTVASEHIRMGLVSAKDGAEGNTRHLLSRSLGTEMFVNVDSSETQVYSGDVLVLCSDGLHGSVETSEIATIAANSPVLADAAHKLVALANQRDGSDNVSVQLIRIKSVERIGIYRGRPYTLH